MFGGKKIKEAEDRIQELELVETRYEKMTEDVQKIKDSTDEMFADLESQNMQIDQEINHLYDEISADSKEEKLLLMGTNQLSEGVSQLKIQKDAWIKEAENWEEYVKTGEKVAAALQDTVTFCGEVQKEEADKKTALQTAVEAAEEEVSKLREAAKGMTTLALNAAIEAGRLGESGFSFLQAAESVRKLSEEYVQHIQIVEEFLAKAAEVYPKEDAAGQLEQLSERTRETADMAGVFCDRGQSDMASLKEQFTEQVELQQEQIAGMQDCIQKKEKARERIEEQIEMIRKNHENSSKAAGEIEERLSLFYGKVL